MADLQWRWAVSEVAPRRKGDRVDIDHTIPEIGAAEELFPLKVQSEAIWSLFEVSPDGQRFLVLEPSGGEPSRTPLALVSDWSSRDSRDGVR